jgi:heme oxygenase
VRDTDDLPARLRRETADLHSSVEAATGLPGSVRTAADYPPLLNRLLGFHSAVETRLAASCWAPEWAALDIDLARHRRSHLIEQDLDELAHRDRAEESTQDARADALPETAPELRIDGFAAALGFLYVVEGSSLGGRIIGPAIRSAIGEVPTRFFESTDRRHPTPWRALTAALHNYGIDGDADEVVAGARSAFRGFEQHVAPPQRIPVP